METVERNEDKIKFNKLAEELFMVAQEIHTTGFIDNVSIPVTNDINAAIQYATIKLAINDYYIVFDGGDGGNEDLVKQATGLTEVMRTAYPNIFTNAKSVINFAISLANLLNNNI